MDLVGKDHCACWSSVWPWRGGTLAQHEVGHRGSSLVGRCRQGARTELPWYSQLMRERLMLRETQGGGMEKWEEKWGKKGGRRWVRKWRQEDRQSGRRGRRRSAVVWFDSITACGEKGGGRGEGGVRMVFTDLFLILYLTHNLLLFLVCLSRLLFNFPYCVSCCQSFAPVCFLSLSVFHFPPFYLCTILWFVVLSFPTCGNSVFTGRQFLHLLLQPHFITAEQCPSTLQGLVVL